MHALNTSSRPIRPTPPPITPSADHFSALALQAEIMAEGRSARAFNPAQLRALAEACRAKAARLRTDGGA